MQVGGAPGGMTLKRPAFVTPDVSSFVKRMREEGDSAKLAIFDAGMAILRMRQISDSLCVSVMLFKSALVQVVRGW